MNTFAIGTHVVILLVGLLGLTGWLPLPRGRRTAAGLLLMGLAMFVLWPGLQESMGDTLVGPAHLLLFGTALWLLIAPGRRRKLPDPDAALDPVIPSAEGVSPDVLRRAMSNGCGCKGVPHAGRADSP